MAPDATEGKELRPPSPDRRHNAGGSQEHAAASRVMSSALPTHRTAARRVTALRVRYGGIAVSRSEPAGSELHAPRDDTAQSGWMTRQARMLFGRLAPASEARRVKMIIRTTPGALRVEKGPAPSAHTSGLGDEKPDQHIGLNPPGCRQDRIHHSGNARRSSGIMRGFDLAANVRIDMAEHGTPVLHIVRRRHPAPGLIVNDARLVRDREPKHVDGRAG